MSAASTAIARRTLAQLYALVFGAVLVLAGIAGFVVDASFGSGTDVSGAELIVFEVNGWHNVVHILSGIAGLAVWRSPAGARGFALGFGAIYVAVTVWGFVAGDHVLWLIPVDAEDNVLHLLIAATGIGAGLASPAGPEPSPAAEARPTAA